jgi:hypothetical protein
MAFAQARALKFSPLGSSGEPAVALNGFCLVVDDVLCCVYRRASAWTAEFLLSALSASDTASEFCVVVKVESLTSAPRVLLCVLWRVSSAMVDSSEVSEPMRSAGWTAPAGATPLWEASRSPLDVKLPTRLMFAAPCGLLLLQCGMAALDGGLPSED